MSDASDTIGSPARTTRLPMPIADMGAFFFWARADSLGFPEDFARQLDDGTLPKIYHASVLERMNAARDRLDAAPIGQPT